MSSAREAEKTSSAARCGGSDDPRIPDIDRSGLSSRSWDFSLVERAAAVAAPAAAVGLRRWSPGGGGPRPKGPNPGAEPALNPLNRPAGNRFAAEPGEYRLVLTVDGTEFVQTLTIEPDPNLPESGISALTCLKKNGQLEKALELTPAIGQGD